LAAVNPTCVFTGGPAGVSAGDIVDGPENTACVVDADDGHAVFWSQPDDLKYDPGQPQAGLAARYGGYLTLFADGKSRILPESTPEDTLKALFTKAGREPVTVPGN